ncbi:MAG TPA: hypothetical protein VGF18_04710 [Candidatus Tumulicola sp.]
MRFVDRYLRICVLAAFAVVTACAGNSAIGVDQLPSPDGASATLGRKAWADPAGSRGNLLYVTDEEANAIFVYGYDSLKFVGYIPLGSEAVGGCVDRAQNVWFTLFGGLMLEFAHGGTSPIATLSSPAMYPTNCSVDPKSGDLAVTGFGHFNGKSLEIYRHAKGQPVLYSPTYGSSGCAYDGHGNLFLDGTSSGDFNIAMLSKGASDFQYFPTTTPVEYPGSMSWNDKQLVVADQSKSTVYQFRISGSTAEQIGSTTFDQSTGVGQFFIQRKRIIVPGPEGFDFVGPAYIYGYPQGGKPLRSLRNMIAPVGAVVSLGAKGGSL